MTSLWITYAKIAMCVSFELQVISVISVKNRNGGRKNFFCLSVYFDVSILCCAYLMMIDLINNEVLGHH